MRPKKEKKILTYIPKHQKDSHKNKTHNFNVTPSVQYSGTKRNSQEFS
jgi:hypothetical protein